MRQQPAVERFNTTFGCVDPHAQQATRHAFAARLHDVCEEKALPKRGRQTQLAKLFGVSQQAAKKWLDGTSYPGIETIVAIADWADVNVNWLLQGAGPRRGNRVAGKVLVLDEAIHLLPTELGTDLIDNLRAKLQRIGKLDANEPANRYAHMLAAYEDEIQRRRH